MFAAKAELVLRASRSRLVMRLAGRWGIQVECCAQILLRIKIAGLKFNRFLQLADRLVQMPLHPLNDAEVAVGFGILRLQSDGLG